MGVQHTALGSGGYIGPSSKGERDSYYSHASTEADIFFPMRGIWDWDMVHYFRMRWSPGNTDQ